MNFHIINTSKQVLLPLNIGKNQFDCFHTVFIDNMVSNFSQDQKKGKNLTFNRHRMPKKSKYGKSLAWVQILNV